MIIYAKFNKFNIGYERFMQKFFILSKTDEDTRPQIGSFNCAADAIDFALVVGRGRND